MQTFAQQFAAQVNREETQRDRNLRLGREDLRTFCSLRKPDFYKPEREYQDILCNTLQAAYEKNIYMY